MGKVLLADLDPVLVRELAARHPFVRFTPTTVTSVDELLAQLREVARQGYAVSDAEWEPGLRSVAAPCAGAQWARVAAAVCALSVHSCMTVTRDGAALPARGESAPPWRSRTSWASAGTATASTVRGPVC